MSAHMPPGWPSEVPPPGVTGWQRRAVSWLLDLCPAEYRGYPVLARHPLLLAYLAAAHVRASMNGTARAVARLRAELADDLPPGTVEEALEVLDREQVRMLGASRAIALVSDAMHGRTPPPRL